MGFQNGSGEELYSLISIAISDHDLLETFRMSTRNRLFQELWHVLVNLKCQCGRKCAVRMSRTLGTRVTTPASSPLQVFFKLVVLLVLLLPPLPLRPGVLRLEGWTRIGGMLQCGKQVVPEHRH